MNGRRVVLLLVLLLLVGRMVVAQDGKNASLAAQLQLMFDADQKYRGLLGYWDRYTQKQKDSVAKLYDLPVARVDRVLWSRQQELDSKNLATLKQIMDVYGYPGKSLVGDTASRYAWYVLQHSDEIERWFPVIEKAGRQGELAPYLVAKMKDRLLTEKKKPQLYGTQAIAISRYDTVTKKQARELMIWPIEDPMNLSTRRKAAGFEVDIETAARNLGARYDPNLTMADVERSLNRIIEVKELYPPEIAKQVKKAFAIKLPKTGIAEYSLKYLPFRYLQLADSCARAGDSVMAGRFFDSVNVYHFLFLDYTPDKLPALFERFKLSDSAQQRYAKRFSAAYYGGKSAAYDSLYKYYHLVKTLKGKLKKAKGLDRKEIRRQLVAADTAHAAFLVDYVRKNGWPSMEDGSLFASVLACRHRDQWYHYFPAMFDGFEKGQVQYSYMKTVRENLIYEDDYKLYTKAILTDAYEWDFSSCLVGVFPPAEVIAEALGKLKTLCPNYDLFFVYHFKGEQTAMKSWSRSGSRNFEKKFWEFFGAMIDSCPELHPDSLKVINTQAPLPSETGEETLKMFVVLKGSE